MTSVPLHVWGLFILTTLATMILFYVASARSKWVIPVSLIWLTVQGIIGYTEFYLQSSLPPRFPLLILPPMVLFLFLFISKKGRNWLDGFDPRWLTWLHMVRIPVEIVLFWLFIHHEIPRLMTFEGRNWDILSGITAPLIAWSMYGKRKNKMILITWNLVSLGLLLNIVIHAILAAESPIQQFAFDQPNRGIFYFPFIWLPGYIVPVVLFSHLICLRHAIKRQKHMS